MIEQNRSYCTKESGDFLLGHSAFVHDAELVVDTSPAMNRLVPFLRNLESGKVQRFHESRTAWKDISLTVKFLVAAVQALNCIGGIDNLSRWHIYSVYSDAKLQCFRLNTAALPLNYCSLSGRDCN